MPLGAAVAVAAAARRDCLLLRRNAASQPCWLRRLASSEADGWMLKSCTLLQVRGAAATSLLAPRRGLASAECKPGKAPKNVDYVGEPLLATLHE